MQIFPRYFFFIIFIFTIKTNYKIMLESILLSLICTQIESGDDGSYIEKITFYQNSFTSEKRVELESYYHESLEESWVIDNKQSTNYQISESGLLSFSVPWEQTIEVKEALIFEQIKAKIQYIIDPETKKFKTIYIEDGSTESTEVRGNCLNLSD